MPLTVNIQVCVSCSLQSRLDNLIGSMLHQGLINLIMEGIPCVPALRHRLCQTQCRPVREDAILLKGKSSPWEASWRDHY